MQVSFRLQRPCLEYSIAFAQFWSDLRLHGLKMTARTSTISSGQIWNGNDPAIVENEDKKVSKFSLSLPPSEKSSDIAHFSPDLEH